MKGLECIKKSDTIMSFKLTRDVRFDAKGLVRAVRGSSHKCSMQSLSHGDSAAKSSTLFSVKGGLEDVVTAECDIVENVNNHIKLYEFALDVGRAIKNTINIYTNIQGSGSKNREILNIYSVVAGINEIDESAVNILPMPEVCINKEMLYYTKSIHRAFNAIYNMGHCTDIGAHLSGYITDDVVYDDVYEIIMAAISFGMANKIVFVLPCEDNPESYRRIQKLKDVATNKMEFIINIHISKMAKALKFMQKQNIKCDGFFLDHLNVRTPDRRNDILKTHITVI